MSWISISTGRNSCTWYPLPEGGSDCKIVFGSACIAPSDEPTTGNPLFPDEQQPEPEQQEYPD